MNQRKAILAALSMIAASSSMASALVANGDFASGDFTDWTQSGDSNYNDVISSAVFSNIQHVALLGAIGDSGALSQVLGTLVGQQYAISFDWQAPGADSNAFLQLSFDGQQIFSTAGTVQDWTHESLTSIASGTSALLQFSYRNDPNFYYVTNISVAAVPELPSPLLISLGCLVPLMARRLRRLPL